MNIKVYAPSNIAFIKYWGKDDVDHQWPSNDSISMSLSKCRTCTYSYIKEDINDYIIYFNDSLLETNDSKREKMVKFLDRIKKEFNFSGGLEIHTSNSFYSDCGIASSASGFCALTISSILSWTGSNSFKELDQKGFDILKLSDISRLGSGSSCRSFMSNFVWWKKNDSYLSQSIESVPSNGWKLLDTIVVTNKNRKKVPSSLGHALAKKSPYFEKRLIEVKDRIATVVKAIENKDIDLLGNCIEEEAYSLHKIIESTMESYLSEDTKKFLDWIRDQREKNGIPMYFTLDAGSSVHIISEYSRRNEVIELIRKNYDYEIIEDCIGEGPYIAKE